MDIRKKRGNEEDIAELVRKKLERHRKQMGKPLRGGEQDTEKMQVDSSYVPSLNPSGPSEIFREASRGKKEILRVSNKNSAKKIPLQPAKKPFQRAKPKPIIKKEEVKHPAKSKTPLIIVSLLIILVFFGILVAVLFLFYNAPLKSGERELSVNDLISHARVTDEKTANIKLVDSLDLERISLVTIIFVAGDSTQYTYYPGYVDKEYTIQARDINLDSFKEITTAVAIVDFKVKPALDSGNASVNITSNPANRTNQSSSPSKWKGDSCTDSCSSLGFNCGAQNICGSSTNCGTCSGGQECRSGKCFVLCTNECLESGMFCSNNTPYNCSLGAAGCLIRTNLTECSSDKQCFGGSCKDIPDCTINSECSKFSDVCSIGICNSGGKCEISYNISSSICRADSGECDVAESCTGVSEKCPNDAFEPDRTSCALGVCSSGQCVECLIDDDCSSDGCYSGEMRNYYCENKQCKYNVINVDENWANGNCNDGIDNDCDNKIDNLDEGCACTPKTCLDLGYQCGIWDNGCSGTVDCGTCTGKDCFNGQCVECVSDSNCSADNCYSGEYRDYYCSSNSCSYNVATQAEKLENGNCKDGKDNDCDGKTDGEDMLCKEFYGPTDYVAYWKFENNANDEKGNYDGILGGDAAYVAGKKGNAIRLDGDDDYMNTSYGYTSSASNPRTYSLWVRHNATGGDPSTPIFLSQSATSGLGSRMYLAIDSGKWAMGIGTSASNSRSNVVADNNWHMITVTMGHPTFPRTVVMYIDGVNIGYSKGYSDYTFTSYLRFGTYSSTFDYDFAGEIDEAMIYERILSEDEIQKIYCSQGGEASFCSGLSSTKFSFWEWIRSLFD